jgi:hypothetical protein
MGCGGVIEGVLGGVAAGDVHPVRVMLAINYLLNPSIRVLLC